ncbi:MAG: beta-ketoacyl-[acyl-carrier-protein] synthase family protein [Bacteroidales bacterium]|nr:beta-ketoacyl-[acyl-carrier-protein] synthase family protein [Bacteroidales bacterium]MDD4670997.1 beta-ketoacyl-[acyl-carrier-protein] synthase family protein [Bacteroidales bacterium]
MTICVTGIGIISSIGVGRQATLDSLLTGRCNIAPIAHFKTIHSDLVSAEVVQSNEQLIELLGGGLKEPLTRTALLGMVALDQAYKEARVEEQRPQRVAFVSGTTVGGMDKSEQFYLDFLNNDSKNQYIASHDCGRCSEMIADYCGHFDIITTISTACSSAANAVIFGANLLKTGRTDMAIVGGSECITKFHLNGFNTLRILDKEPCRPFDASRAGLNLGEGAAYLVLESEASALKRGVEPLCKLSGYANFCDAHHQTASSEDGEGAFLAMSGALQNSGLQPEDIDYINAHGTGTVNNDLSEGIAISRLFSKRGIPPVSSTKSFTGHTTSASGSIEAVISILSIQHGFIPANLRFRNKIEELSFVPSSDIGLKVDVNNVLTNSFGFGGNDTTLIFSKYKKE